MAESKQKKQTSSPEGLYDGDIYAERLVDPGNDNVVYFEVDVNITHRVDAVTNKPVALPMAIKRSARVYISEGTLEYLPQKLAALGFHGQIEQLDPGDKNHISVVGNHCRLLNKPKAGEGRNVGKTFDEFQPFFESQRQRPESTAGAGKKLKALFGKQFTPLPAPAGAADKKPSNPPPADDANSGGTDDGGNAGGDGGDEYDEVPF
jgi:hypothetical protein